MTGLRACLRLTVLPFGASLLVRQGTGGPVCSAGHGFWNRHTVYRDRSLTAALGSIPDQEGLFLLVPVVDAQDLLGHVDILDNDGFPCAESDVYECSGG